MSTPTTEAPRRARTAKPKLDAVSAAAVEMAREALAEVTEPGQAGEHLRAEASGERLVSHVFECTMPGYRGWSWVVVLARAPRAKAPTVAETALLPGEESLLSPDWEPWAERLQPSDVGADDLLPYRERDERLEQGFESTGEADVDAVAQWELGLGRARVLSPEGRAEAAERWVGGDFGPRQVSSRKRRDTVSATCASCGFVTQLAGSLRGEFGVCTNEWSPADGRVVHLGYGCGSHSETGQEDGDKEIQRSTGVIVDEHTVELDHDTAPAAQPEAEDAVETVEPAQPAEQDPAGEQKRAAEQDAPVVEDVPEQQDAPVEQDTPTGS